VWMRGYVRLRARASTSSGNQPRASSAQAARSSAGPPGVIPASTAGTTYLRTVLRSDPRLWAMTSLGRPACQCWSTSRESLERLRVQVGDYLNADSSAAPAAPRPHGRPS
jgi:hypothetical protein